MTNRAVCSFFAWLEQHGIGGLVDIEPFHVAAYIKALKVSDAGNPAVKERAAARPTVQAAPCRDPHAARKRSQGITAMIASKASCLLSRAAIRAAPTRA